MRAEQAAQQGFVTRSPDGTYTDNEGNAPQSNREVFESLQAERQEAEQEEREAEENTPIRPTEAISEEADQGIVELQSRIGNQATASVANELIAGEGSYSQLNDLASQLGMEPEKVGEGLSKIVDAHKEQANSFIASEAPDVDPETLWAWSARNLSTGERHDAMRQQVFRGDMSGYKKMLNAFRGQQSASDAGSSAGIGGDDGLVIINGMQMKRTQAVELGLMER